MCSFYLQTVATPPQEVQKSDFSTVILTKHLFFKYFHRIYQFKVQTMALY